MTIIRTAFSETSVTIVTTDGVLPYAVVDGYDTNTKTWAFAYGYKADWEEAKALRKEKMKQHK